MPRILSIATETVLFPGVIADAVVGELSGLLHTRHEVDLPCADGLADYLAEKANDIYARNEFFRRRIRLHLSSGSIWNEDVDWMMGLVKGDREMESVFEGGKCKSEHIAAVVLEAKGTDGGSGYLRLIYEFQGWDDYADVLKAQEDSSF